MNKKKAIFAVLTFIISLPVFSATVTEASLRENFIESARKYLGTPYVYGGTSEAGMDCSGFVYVSAKDCGISDLPRTAKQIYSASKNIDKDEAKRGDLVFFTDKSKVSHVGIYVGNSQFIHCASEGSKTGVIISKLSESYWKKHFYAYGRIINSKTVAEVKHSKDDDTISTWNDNSKSKNKKPVFDLNFTLYGNWGSLDLNNDQSDYIQSLGFNGYSVEGQMLFHIKNASLGLMSKISINPYTNNIYIPVCGIIGGKHLSVYGGLVFLDETAAGASIVDSFVENTDNWVVGLQLQTSPLTVGNYKFTIVQDISCNTFKSKELAETKGERNLGHVDLETGLRITF